MSVIAGASKVKSSISSKASVKHPAVRVRDSSVSRGLKIRKDYVAVLVPAHNEQADIADTIMSLRGLRRVPDRILVISDNSTDKTVEIASAMGVEVIETVGNIYKKAGALNAGFRHVIQDGTMPEFIITMDADTVFDENFVSSGLNVLASDAKLGVLSAVCSGKKGLVSLPSEPPSQARHLDSQY